MTTTVNGPTLDPQHQMHVRDMPPMVVTTTGIPAEEHAAPFPTLTPATPATTAQMALWEALFLVGILVVVIGAVVYGLLQPVT